MERVRVILVGGFLGSGKTTLLHRVARNLKSVGKRVALITNDQASELVDTEFLRRDGLKVGEVSGGCFCCKFPELASQAERAIAVESAEVILGEPVGSCTDLSATVIQPLKHLYGDKFDVAPLTVLVDPSRVQEAFQGEGSRRFPDSVYYIFWQQIAEADTIVINKSDLIPAAELGRLGRQVTERFPETPVIAMSARTGAGFELWLDFIDSRAPSGQRIAQVDYEVYAEGEAVLGWLNARLRIEAPLGADWGAFAATWVAGMQQLLKVEEAEIAHIKLALSTSAGSIAANLTNSVSEPLIRGKIAERSREATVVVNARVHIDPEELARIFQESLPTSSGEHLQTQILSLQSFSPARPQPTHRYSSVVRHPLDKVRTDPLRYQS